MSLGTQDEYMPFSSSLKSEVASRWRLIVAFPVNLLVFFLFCSYSFSFNTGKVSAWGLSSRALSWHSLNQHQLGWHWLPIILVQYLSWCTGLINQSAEWYEETQIIRLSSINFAIECFLILIFIPSIRKLASSNMYLNYDKG